MKYIFKTNVTMKEYNYKNWWIDNDVIPEYCVNAESLNKALESFVKFAYDKAYITVSRNALRNKNKMYIDLKDGTSKQIGYVITGSTDFQKENYSGWSKQYVDLWIEVITITETDFSEVA